MISDQQLIELNHQGFIPGPSETEDLFLARVSLTRDFFNNPHQAMGDEDQKDFLSFQDKVKKPRWSWVRSCLVHLFDFSPENVSAFFDDHQLPFFQGGVTWVLEKEEKGIRVPVIQVKKKLQSGTYLGIYTLEEILAHEATHAARIAFDEKNYEEIFAYWSSSSYIRRMIGPLLTSTKQVVVLLSGLLLMLLFQFLSVLHPLKIFSMGYVLSSLGLLGSIGWGLGKLFFLRRRMKKTINHLKEIVISSSKARNILFRLTDEEIHLFSTFSPARILEYIKEQLKRNDLRWRMIHLCYFR